MIENKTIDVRGAHYPTLKKALLELQDAILDGYRLDEDAVSATRKPVVGIKKLRIPLVRGEAVKGDSEEAENTSEEKGIEVAPKEEETGALLTEEALISNLVSPAELEASEAYDILEDKKASKKDLLEYAEVEGIEIPVDRVMPAAIRKFLKEYKS